MKRLIILMIVVLVLSSFVFGAFDVNDRDSWSDNPHEMATNSQITPKLLAVNEPDEVFQALFSENPIVNPNNANYEPIIAKYLEGVKANLDKAKLKDNYLGNMGGIKEHLKKKSFTVKSSNIAMVENYLDILYYQSNEHKKIQDEDIGITEKFLYAKLATDNVNVFLKTIVPMYSKAKYMTIEGMKEEIGTKDLEMFRKYFYSVYSDNRENEHLHLKEEILEEDSFMVNKYLIQKYYKDSSVDVIEDDDLDVAKKYFYTLTNTHEITNIGNKAEKMQTLDVAEKYFRTISLAPGHFTINFEYMKMIRKDDGEYVFTYQIEDDDENRDLTTKAIKNLVKNNDVEGISIGSDGKLNLGLSSKFKDFLENKFNKEYGITDGAELKGKLVVTPEGVGFIGQLRSKAEAGKGVSFIIDSSESVAIFNKITDPVDGEIKRAIKVTRAKLTLKDMNKEVRNYKVSNVNIVLENQGFLHSIKGKGGQIEYSGIDSKKVFEKNLLVSFNKGRIQTIKSNHLFLNTDDDVYDKTLFAGDFFSPEGEDGITATFRYGKEKIEIKNLLWFDESNKGKWGKEKITGFVPVSVKGDFDPSITVVSDINGKFQRTDVVNYVFKTPHYYVNTDAAIANKFSDYYDDAKTIVKDNLKPWIDKAKEKTAGIPYLGKTIAVIVDAPGKLIPEIKNLASTTFNLDKEIKYSLQFDQYGQEIQMGPNVRTHYSYKTTDFDQLRKLFTNYNVIYVDGPQSNQGDTSLIVLEDKYRDLVDTTLKYNPSIVPEVWNKAKKDKVSKTIFNKGVKSGQEKVGITGPEGNIKFVSFGKNVEVSTNHKSSFLTLQYPENGAPKSGLMFDSNDYNDFRNGDDVVNYLKISKNSKIKWIMKKIGITDSAMKFKVRKKLKEGIPDDQTEISDLEPDGHGSAEYFPKVAVVDIREKVGLNRDASGEKAFATGYQFVPEGDPNKEKVTYVVDKFIPVHADYLMGDVTDFLNVKPADEPIPNLPPEPAEPIIPDEVEDFTLDEPEEEEIVEEEPTEEETPVETLVPPQPPEQPQESAIPPVQGDGNLRITPEGSGEKALDEIEEKSFGPKDVEKVVVDTVKNMLAGKEFLTKKEFDAGMKQIAKQNGISKDKVMEIVSEKYGDLENKLDKGLASIPELVKAGIKEGLEGFTSPAPAAEPVVSEADTAEAEMKLLIDKSQHDMIKNLLPVFRKSDHKEVKPFLKANAIDYGLKLRSLNPPSTKQVRKATAGKPTNVGDLEINADDKTADSIPAIRKKAEEKSKQAAAAKKEVKDTRDTTDLSFREHRARDHARKETMLWGLGAAILYKRYDDQHRGGRDRGAVQSTYQQASYIEDEYNEAEDDLYGDAIFYRMKSGQGSNLQNYLLTNNLLSTAAIPSNTVIYDAKYNKQTDKLELIYRHISAGTLLYVKPLIILGTTHFNALRSSEMLIIDHNVEDQIHEGESPQQPSTPSEPVTIAEPNVEVPDLTIIDLDYSEQQQTDILYFKIRAKNQGNKDITTAFAAKLTIGDFIAQATVDSLRIGEVKEVTFDPPYNNEGTIGIARACVDVDTEVDELNENNNCYQANYGSHADDLPCIDSDGGEVEDALGTTEGSSSSGESLTQTDSCVDQTKVKEYYCDSDGFLKSKEISCASSDMCDEGACSAACVDDDGGKYSGVAGVARGLSQADTSIRESGEDYCVSENSIMEFYCSGGGFLLSETITCPNGYICHEDKCVEKCVDSDDGQDKTVKGTVTGPLDGVRTTKTDSCNSNKPQWVIEYSCGTNDNLQSDSIKCADGQECSDGACVDVQ